MIFPARGFGFVSRRRRPWALVFCLLIIVKGLSAQEAVLLGGVLEGAWRTDTQDAQSAATSNTTELTQNLELRATGSIITPNLLSWSLGGGVRDENRHQGDTRFRLRRFTAYDLRLEFLRVKPLSFHLLTRDDIHLTDTQQLGLPRREDRSLEGGLRLVSEGWPLMRVSHRLQQVQNGQRTTDILHTTQVDLRNNAPTSDVELSYRDELQGGDHPRRLQEMQLRGFTKIWDESTALSADTRIRQDTQSREMFSTLRLRGRWREQDRLDVDFGSNVRLVRDGSRHAVTLGANDRRQLSKCWNTVARSQINSLKAVGFGALHTWRHQEAAGLEYMNQRQDSLEQSWERVNLLANALGDGRLSRIGATADFSLERRRNLTKGLEGSWSAMTGLLFRTEPGGTGQGWASSLRGQLDWQPGDRLLATQRVDLQASTGGGLRQSVGCQTEVSWSPTSPLWTQAALHLVREQQPLRRNQLDANTSVAWPLSQRLVWITEASLSYLGNGRPLSRKARSALELNQQRLHILLEARVESRDDRRNVGATFTLSRTLGDT